MSLFAFRSATAPRWPLAIQAALGIAVPIAVMTLLGRPYYERVQIIDTLGAVGEVLSWIGLGIGIPLLVIAGMVALAEGRWDRIDIAVIERDGTAIARWFVGGDFHERPLTAHEDVGDGWHRGFVSARTPSHARMNPPVLRRLFTTLGAVFTVVGIIGFILSMLPAFV